MVGTGHKREVGWRWRRLCYRWRRPSAECRRACLQAMVNGVSYTDEPGLTAAAPTSPDGAPYTAEDGTLRWGPAA